MSTTMGSIDLKTFKDLRDDVTQYFWFESDSSSAWGSGAHVTLYPESQFTNSTSPNYMKGQNIIMNTDGFSIRNGVLPMMVLDNDSLDFNTIDTVNGTYTTVASFGATSTIGVTDGTQSYLYEDYHSLQMIDKDGKTYFHVSYLPNKQDEIVDAFTGTGGTRSFDLSLTATSSTYVVTVDGTEVSSGITKSTTAFIFTTAPTNGAVIKATYTPSTSLYLYAYTLGIREQNRPVGRCSVAEGYNTVASGAMSHAEGSGSEAIGGESHAEGFSCEAVGRMSHAEGQYAVAKGEGSHAEGVYSTAYAYAYASHAEGYSTKTRGSCSHAEGWSTEANGDMSHSQNEGTVANGESQTVLGTYNTADTTTSTTHPSEIATYGNYAVIIGNGTADDARSNALTVDWDGNVKCAGYITASGHTNPIGWYDAHNNTSSISSGTTYQSISASAISLAPGRYMLFGSARFSGASSGYRGITIYEGNDSIGRAAASQPCIPSSSWTTALNTSCFVAVSSTTTYKLGVYQNCGSSLSTAWDFYAVAIR